jgi:1-acyl-sn-glycerol-3-phosphate acyltransferase
MYWRGRRWVLWSHLPRLVSASRIARVAAHLAFAFILESFHGKNRNEFRQRWSRKLLAILEVTVEARNLRIAPGTLLIANHVSWLDVIVLSVFCPADFVAKAEIRRWPLLGWLLERNDCLFVGRRAGRHLLRLNAEIGERLARGRVVAFFPEGTTTNGAGLLPFRTALFEPAVRGGHRFQAFALAYRDSSGQRSDAAAFIDQQSLWQSLLAIASQPGIVAALRASPTVGAAGLTRRQAACIAQAAIQERLADSAPVATLPLSGCELRPPSGEQVLAHG